MGHKGLGKVEVGRGGGETRRVNSCSENDVLILFVELPRYKHEILVDGDPVIFEICDTCPKVSTATSVIIISSYSLSELR